MSEQHFDTIVVGIGAMGSAACYHLARRGQRVLGLERFDIPHSQGSSHGVNRIIRLAYYEDPSYVPLLRRAYALWRELEQGFGEQLLHITGSIDASEGDSWLFEQSRLSCDLHGLPYEVLTSAQLRERFPAYHLPEGHLALLQPEGGFVASERAIVAHVLGAIEAGAEIHAREAVTGWELTADGVRVETTRGEYKASKLVLSAGAWMGDLTPGLDSLLVRERQVLGWFQPTKPALYDPIRFPVFNLAHGDDRYYGFPVFGVPGFKFGQYHHRGEVIDPDTMNREPEPEDEALLREAAGRYFPDGVGPTMSLKACIFTNSPDEHFLLDLLPADDRVVVASPCSGHGYKFASVIGEIAADLAISGETAHDIGLFRLDRFEVMRSE
ncbi:MAG: N-methyl-L-tryptophan oxidase [Thermomicrobiales bacterium]|nr:N-methyl-L-tryptophan oxidase [Thermomicrobiales bacterium]